MFKAVWVMLFWAICQNNTIFRFLWSLAFVGSWLNLDLQLNSMGMHQNHKIGPNHDIEPKNAGGTPTGYYIFDHQQNIQMIHVEFSEWIFVVKFDEISKMFHITEYKLCANKSQVTLMTHRNVQKKADTHKKWWTTIFFLLLVFHCKHFIIHDDSWWTWVRRYGKTYGPFCPELICINTEYEKHFPAYIHSG